MKFCINANVCDPTTTQIAAVLREPFELIASELSKDYGGTMQHLWIDFELSEMLAEFRAPFPFRFQKRVGGSASKLTGLPTTVHRNVGHYSVRPDFGVLRSTPPESFVVYALSVIYTSTIILVEKQKQIGGFDAVNFRSNFVTSCRQHGYCFAEDENQG